MEETTSDSPKSSSDENNRINELDIESSCKDNNDTEHHNGERTPQQSERYIDNSIFNTISKIVNPATKVSTLVFFISNKTESFWNQALIILKIFKLQHNCKKLLEQKIKSIKILVYIKLKYTLSSMILIIDLIMLLIY